MTYKRKCTFLITMYNTSMKSSWELSGDFCSLSGDSRANMSSSSEEITSVSMGRRLGFTSGGASTGTTTASSGTVVAAPGNGQDSLATKQLFLSSAPLLWLTFYPLWNSTAMLPLFLSSTTIFTSSTLLNLLTASLHKSNRRISTLAQPYTV